MILLLFSRPGLFAAIIRVKLASIHKYTSFSGVDFRQNEVLFMTFFICLFLEGRSEDNKILFGRPFVTLI
jgi:hypothetical protein